MPFKVSSKPVWANRSNSKLSSKPRLPAELESMVLDNCQDLHDPKELTWLWVGARHVSKHFRYEVERIFRTILLPETSLYCDMGKLFRCGPQLSR